MENINPHISVVSPVYMGEKMVQELISRIVESVSTITQEFDIILVNDASPDRSWNAIKEECKKDSRVKGINLSRNFGQHYAITAGLNYAKGNWVVVMDCDLQDRPEEIPNLYNKAQEGWDIVYARRIDRQDGTFKRLSSVLFHNIFRFLSGIQTDRTIANFGIFNRNVIAEFNKMPEVSRSFSTLISLLGFKRTTVDVAHSERLDGQSSYSLFKLIKLSTDVILANSNKPLHLAVQLGFIISFISFVLAFYNVIAKLIGIIEVEGFTTTIFSIWFVGGMIMLVLGIVGLYIGKIFEQVKGRQLFIVSEKINL